VAAGRAHQDPAAVLARADEEMYEVKRRARGRLGDHSDALATLEMSAVTPATGTATEH
jgi:hypothetical protein